MNRRTLSRASESSPTRGRYSRVELDGQPTARIACPECGTIGLLDHKITEDGTVDPSVVCPSDGCDWHEWIRLEGWGEP